MTVRNTLSTLLALVLAFGCIAIAHEAKAEKFFALYNYPDLDWYVIRTEHFNTFYPVSKKGPETNRFYVDGSDAARKCALVNEEMYEPTCKQYDTFLEETINVVILEQPDDLWGYTIPNFDWIVISSKHDDMLWRWRGHGDWLRLVMYHEYAHVVSLKADSVFAENGFGWYLSARWRDGAYNIDTGATMIVGDGDPWWWVEGGAEYTSEVAGINTWNSNRDMWMRADILEGTLLEKDEWEDYYGSNGGFDGERHYNSGYNFAVYLEEQYGEGIYQSFAKTRREKGWTANWDRVVEDTLNVTVEELRQGWIDWATAKYKKVEADVMAEPAIGAEMRYTMPDWEKPEDDEDRIKWEKQRFIDKRKDKEASGWMRMFPRYSPDGRYYADYDLRGAKLRIQEVDEETWMPIRRKYLDEEEDEELIGELGKRQVASGWAKGTAANVSGSGQYDWSPDGTKIVTQCMDHEVSRAAHATKFYTYPRGYAWNSLCVSEVTEDEEGEKLQMAVLHRIPGALRAQDPAWSPDGEWIAYTEFASGNQWLKKIRVDDESENGDTEVTLTPFDDGTQIEMVDWSPDGTQLVFGAFRHNMQDLWIVNADGTGLRPITHDKYEDRDPYWADDGMIYFSSDRVDGIFNIFRFNPDAEIGWADGDGDGIMDTEDACPEEPETVNNYKDEDGCPDRLPVRITAERVEIDQKIFFETGTANIKPESHGLLDMIAATLVEHGELTKLEVAGHTDRQGKAKDNLELSKDRAQAVTDYLVGQGVAAERLAAKGYGEGQPLVQTEDDVANDQNRRVEFLILERAEKGKAVAEDGEVAPPEKDEQPDDGEETGEDRAVAEPEDAEAPEAPDTGNGKKSLAEVLEQAPEALLVARDARDEFEAAKVSEEQLDNAALIQITNVLYGAFTPSITPQGHLLYSYYTAYGWKAYGLNKEDFYNRVADDTALAIAEGDYDLGPQEEIPTYAESTYKVPTGGKYLRPPMAIPLLIVQNISRSHVGFTGGVQMWGSDFLSNHDAFLIALFGEDMYVGGQVQINKFGPDLHFGGMYRQIKYDYAYLFDRDEDVETTDDVFLGDLKGVQYLYAGYGGIDFNINNNMELGYNHVSYGLNYKQTSSGLDQTPLFYHNINTLHFAIASFSEQAFYRGSFGINPSGGVRLSLDASVNYSDILYEWSNGVDADDGQLLSDYVYPEFEFRAIGYIPMPWAKEWQHTLQVDFQLGIIPQNVSYNDEFRGGGQSALNYRNPWSTNTAFSGYESWSLGGETMGILNAAYRLPIRRNIDKKFGVMYLESIWLQFFGTAGNFWSYRTREGAPTYDFYGDPVAVDQNDVIRELPFSDRLENCPDSVRERNGGECGRALFPVATQNGNRMLFDAGVELRIRANLFNRNSWNSFIRVAYGFNEVGGIFDVDGDDIVTNVDDPNLNAISSEKERASIRFYIGLGTGW